MAANERVVPEIGVGRETVSSLSGTPEYELGRRVFISRPARAMSQAGCMAKTGGWKLTYQHEDRWANPLMGWTSTRDPYTNLTLRFETLDEALEHVLFFFEELFFLLLLTFFFFPGMQRNMVSIIKLKARMVALIHRTSFLPTMEISSCTNHLGRELQSEIVNVFVELKKKAKTMIHIVIHSMHRQDEHQCLLMRFLRLSIIKHRDQTIRF